VRIKDHHCVENHKTASHHEGIKGGEKGETATGGGNVVKPKNSVGNNMGSRRFNFLKGRGIGYTRKTGASAQKLQNTGTRRKSGKRESPVHHAKHFLGNEGNGELRKDTPYLDERTSDDKNHPGGGRLVARRMNLDTVPGQNLESGNQTTEAFEGGGGEDEEKKRGGKEEEAQMAER